MHRNVMHLRADACGVEAAHQNLAPKGNLRELESRRIEMPSRVAIGHTFWRQDLGSQLGKQPIIGANQSPPPRDEIIELVDLAQTERAINVAGTVVETDLRHLVVPRVWLAI